jgi:ParB family transcriptional regulator, chromosome partitioning protein
MMADRIQHRVELIPVDAINILNPRVRNRRVFREITDNIAEIGLKRPITVSRARRHNARPYNLVCGQGRLEAFIELGQSAIPAIVVTASEEDCLVMGLVENLARRQHPAVDLMQEIGALRRRGYGDTDIARKIGMTSTWVGMVIGLLDKGEQRLVAAVETGMLPISLAVDIAKSDDTGIQRLLAAAYAEKKVRGKKLMVLRRLLEQRARRGKHLSKNLFGQTRAGRAKPVTTEALLRVYREEADKQKLLIKKAEITQSRLMFAVEAPRTLRQEKEFIALLKTEGLDTMPRYLDEQLGSGGGP